ncbi:unnamed protein product, partial [Closterium sp. NIES-54]
ILTSVYSAESAPPVARPLPSLTALALLNVKAALGVTFTSWAAASPCAIANSTITIGGTWTGVLCSSAGDVLSVNLSSSALAGSMHADITKLTALTYLSVPSPTCQCFTRLLHLRASQHVPHQCCVFPLPDAPPPARLAPPSPCPPPPTPGACF